MTGYLANYGTQLAEVLDKYRRPVCLLPAREILKQKLAHRAVGVLAGDESSLLLQEYEGPMFGFTGFGPALRNLSLHESASAYIEGVAPFTIGESRPIVKLDDPASGAQISVHRVYLSPALLAGCVRAGFEIVEIQSLQKFAGMQLLHPLFFRAALKAKLIN